MKDTTKKVSFVTLQCLKARLNEYARNGALVTKEADAAEILGPNYASYEELKTKESYTFSKGTPVPGKRYRYNRFTASAVSVVVWHEDDDGDWLFVSRDDDRLCLAKSPAEGRWCIWRCSNRGEFREYDECVNAIGTADLLAAEEIK